MVFVVNYRLGDEYYQGVYGRFLKISKDNIISGYSTFVFPFYS